MTFENRSLGIRNEWQRVEEALEAARALLKAKLYRDSISRAYYAVFHAASAALLALGLEAKSHAGIRSLFSLHLVRSEKIDSKSIRILSRMQKFREEADYDPEIVFNDSDARESLADAETFCKQIKRFLREERLD